MKFRSIFAGIVCAILSPLVGAETIAVIGTGDVGAALGPEFASQGHAIVYGSREPDRESVRALVARTPGEARATTPGAAVTQAGIVVLAVPGALAAEITAGLGDLDDKIIIDPTNHIVRDGDFPVSGAESSNAEAIQAAAPGAHVVKAFNTLNWRTMVDPAASGGPVSIPLVGNDTAAKAVVANLVSGMGLEAVDLGPLAYARHVEGMLIVWMHARIRGQGFEYHLRKAP